MDFMVIWHTIKATKIPMLLNMRHCANRPVTASRYLLGDGIHYPGVITTRISAHFVSLLCNYEPQRIKAATLDVIDELSRAIQLGSTLYVVIYGTKRAYVAARLITSNRLARHVRLILTERELSCGLLTIPRIFLYQVDTDRYPFTDNLLQT